MTTKHKRCSTLGASNAKYRQMMVGFRWDGGTVGQREEADGYVVEVEQEGQCQHYFQGLAALSLTWQRDLDSEEKWIWPQGRVELWHWLRRRRRRRRRMWSEVGWRGSVGRTEKRVKVYVVLWECNYCLKSLETH